MSYPKPDSPNNNFHSGDGRWGEVLESEFNSHFPTLPSEKLSSKHMNLYHSTSNLEG